MFHNLAETNLRKTQSLDDSRRNTLKPIILETPPELPQLPQIPQALYQSNIGFLNEEDIVSVMSKCQEPQYIKHNDPCIKQNQPIKQSFQIQFWIILGSLFLLCGFILFAAGKQIVMRVIVLVVGYIFYLIVACNGSNSKEFIQNIEHLKELPKKYSQMTHQRAYFVFRIQCYHYQIQPTGVGKQSRLYRNRVITHSAEEIFELKSFQDESGLLSQMTTKKKFLFAKFQKKYYFTDKESQQNFARAFKSFVKRNTQDTYQDYRHSFEIEGYRKNVSFTPDQNPKSPLTALNIFTTLGLSLPFHYFLECFVDRYQFTIIKRIQV